MKVCENCGREINTKDGENTCSQCDTVLSPQNPRRSCRQRAKKERESVYELLGLTKVKGAMGGVYWE